MSDPTATPVTTPPKPSKDTTTTTTPPEDNASWHKEACAEAVIDRGAALLTKTAATKSSSYALKAVLVRSDRLWDNGAVLNCGFMDKAPLTNVQINQQAKVREVAVEWSEYANITLNFVEDVTTATVRITFDPNGGSWSFVGKEVSSIVDGKLPTMNLGWIDGSNDIVSASEHGVILHEFGHTLGLMHEHQSPARGNKITLKKDAVIEFYTSTQGWSVGDVEAQIINVYNKDDVSNYSDVDLTSVMQYFMPPQLNEQGIRVNPNNKLSELDKAFMVINYPPFAGAEGKPDPSKRAQFEAALDVTGVVGGQKATIMKYYDAQNWTDIRYEFTSFCTDMHIARKAASVVPVGPVGPVAPSRALEPAKDISEWCLTEVNDDDGSGPGKGAAKGVATLLDDLWLPGDTVTYSYLQGSSEATEYRKKRIRDTFNFYSAIANIRFQEIPFVSKLVSAAIHIYFGPIPDNGAGWTKIGKVSYAYRQTTGLILKRGGSTFSSFVISPEAMPKVAPTDKVDIIVEARTLYHEIGHILGLKHEHASPYTLTTDKPDKEVSVATYFDDKSIMLYADHKLRNSPGFDKIKDRFDPGKTQFNHVPSTLDIAFIGALYPHRKGHVDDHFEENMKDLGLTGSQTELGALRDAAFAIEGHANFVDKLKAYRTALQEKLALNVPQRLARPLRAVPPSNFKAPNDAAVSPPSKATQGPFLDELSKILQGFFQPTTGQLFALQFPGRFLQKDLYAWDTNTAGIYGQFVKPTVVNESEFRLVDQLYNVGTVVGAPNGMNLSIIYEQCLNNLIPGITKPAINLSKQQSEIRKWLLKGVTTNGWVKDLISSQHAHASKGVSSSGPASGKASKASSAFSDLMEKFKPQFAVADRLAGDNKVNRMELADALMQEYLSAKQAWELERDDMIKNAKGEDLDDLTRRLAHITAVREAQLASKHADAVVRGYSHAIRQYLGFLDVKSPAEFLQDAKDALRESAMSSLDGSMKVYPVQMSPVDWFQSLSTSFTMEDLTVNQDVISQQIDLKSKQLDFLMTRLASIQAKPKTNIEEMRAKLEAAQTAYERAQTDLASTYTSNVISLAKTFINNDNQFMLEAFKLEASKHNIADKAITNIESGMKKLSEAQLTVTQSSRALALLMSQESLAQSTDTTQEIIETNVQITALQKDIAELTTRLQTLRYSSPSTEAAASEPAKPNSVEDIPMHPPTSSSGGSRWQDIYMKHEIQNKYTASSETSKVKNTNTDCGLFFGSYHSKSQETSSTSQGVSFGQNVVAEVGFRATMVTVDRGGWFQPQFFKQSAGFHSINPQITWSKWPDNVKTLQDLSKDPAKSFTELNQHLLPAFPIGFLICKDITIRIHMSESEVQAAGADMEKYAASATGVLCWTTTSNEHEKKSDKSYSFVQKSDGCVIRIPGPQILGYMLQYTDNDNTTVIPDKLPDDFLLSDADYDAALNSQPAHTVDPATATPETSPASK